MHPDINRQQPQATGPHGYYPWSSRTFRLQRGTKAFFPSATLPRGFPPRGYVDAPVFAGAAGAVAIDQFAGFGIGSRCVPGVALFFF